MKNDQTVTVMTMSPPYRASYKIDSKSGEIVGKKPSDLPLRSGVRVRRGPDFRTLLETWIELNEDLALRWSDERDVPWWYNERAVVGLFAGAVWRCEEYAFEEYGAKKKVSGRALSGRVDLEFSLRDEVFVCEAKQCWPKAEAAAEYLKEIDETLARAETDVRRCAPPQGLRRLAMVFAIPSFPKEDGSPSKAQLSVFLRALRNASCSAYAWVFPDLDHEPIHGGRYFPGLAVLLREAKD